MNQSVNKRASDDASILELERIHGESGSWRGIYTLGLKSNPRYLTVKSQQKRAVKLANILSELWVKDVGEKSTGRPDAPRIAVIGGGFGGLTLSAYLAEKSLSWKTTGKKAAGNPLRWEVTVFEQQNQLVPIQRGCSIRKLHPAIHTWPEKTCFDFPAAPIKNGALGLLEWPSAAAGSVAGKFVSDVLSLHRQSANWQIIQSANVKILNQTPDDPKYSLICEGQRISTSSAKPVSARGTWHADIVVFATGFGVEEPDDDGANRLSYWRNDDLGQAPLYGQKQRFIISGAGDGALTDLFRLCLYDFSYDVVMSTLLPVEQKCIEDKLTTAYSRIHPKSRDTKKDCQKLFKHYHDLLDLLKKPGTDVFQSLESSWESGSITKNKVDGQALGYLAEAFLVGLCKSDVEVIVQVLPEFAVKEPGGHPLRALINNPKSMLYNRVLAYLLWRVGAFELRASATPKEVIEEEKWDPSSVKIIVRRGAQWRDAILNRFAANLHKEIMNNLENNSIDISAKNEVVEAYLLGKIE